MLDHILSASKHEHAAAEELRLAVVQANLHYIGRVSKLYPMAEYLAEDIDTLAEAVKADAERE